MSSAGQSSLRRGKRCTRVSPNNIVRDVCIQMELTRAPAEHFRAEVDMFSKAWRDAAGAVEEEASTMSDW